MRFLALLAVLAALVPAPSRAAAPAARILAAENMYADIARQIAGPDAIVAAVMSNPDTDPHLFEASPAIAREIAHADIVVANGAGYDPWIELATRRRSPPRPDGAVDRRAGPCRAGRQPASVV